MGPVTMAFEGQSPDHDVLGNFPRDVPEDGPGFSVSDAAGQEAELS